MGDSLPAEVGARLRAARHRCGYTLAEAGREVGRDASMVLRYERGETPITIDLLAAFARCYRTSLLDLLAPLPASRKAKGAA